MMWYNRCQVNICDMYRMFAKPCGCFGTMLAFERKVFQRVSWNGNIWATMESSSPPLPRVPCVWSLASCKEKKIFLIAIHRIIIGGAVDGNTWLDKMAEKITTCIKSLDKPGQFFCKRIKIKASQPVAIVGAASNTVNVARWKSSI